MPLLDGRGRLFGKINLIDAAVALFVIVLVPLGYAAYALFRTPAPHVTAIKPSSFKTTKGEHVVLEGDHLRPFLRAFAGAKEVEYLFESPDKAQVALPELPTGTYDLTLFDESHPVAKAGTITVAPPPPTPKVLLTIVGTFNGLEPAQAPALRAGIKIGYDDPKVQPAEWMEVLGVQPPRPAIALLSDAALSGIELPNRVQVVAAVRLQATLAGKDVTFRDTKIASGAELSVPFAGEGIEDAAKAAGGPLTFIVQHVYPERTTPVDVHVRFIARPDVVSSIKREQSAKLPSAFESLTPRVVSMDNVQDLLGETKADLREGRISVGEGTFRLPAARTLAGWSYDNHPLRAGAELTIETSDWSIAGTILSVHVADSVEH